MKQQHPLNIACLSLLPLPYETVQRAYDAATILVEQPSKHAVERLCLSHERLRSELAGAERLLDEGAKTIEGLKADLKTALDKLQAESEWEDVA